MSTEYTLSEHELAALRRLAARLSLSADDPDGLAVLATAQVRIERLSDRVEELEAWAAKLSAFRSGVSGALEAWDIDGSGDAENQPVNTLDRLLGEAPESRAADNTPDDRT